MITHRWVQNSKGEYVAEALGHKPVTTEVAEPAAGDEIWRMKATSPEYAALTIDELDRAAFGFSREDITTLQPKQLKIKWQVDYDNAVETQNASGLTQVEWAKTIDLSKPIDVTYEDGVFKVDDGYHRYYAAKILEKPLNVSLEIKDKPHRTIVEKALSEGKPVPLRVLAEYPDLLNEYSITELSEICHKQGLLRSGSKSDLINRLERHLQGR